MLVGKYIDGFSVSELAQIMANPEKSVESLFTRARGRGGTAGGRQAGVEVGSMASLDRSSNPKILLDDEEDFRNVFAELACAPLPMRAAYATQLRGTLRSELAAQAARRARPWWRLGGGAR